MMDMVLTPGQLLWWHLLWDVHFFCCSSSGVSLGGLSAHAMMNMADSLNHNVSKIIMVKDDLQVLIVGSILMHVIGSIIGVL